MAWRSTYRVQLWQEFGFAAAAGVAGYLAELGVSHLYCSPYLQAPAGSAHGYDVVDPERLNDELGGAAGHAAMVGALRAAGLGQVLDIVPNHMATDATNGWWWDVLENGPASRYASVFAIDWDGGERSGHTVLVPVLGDHYGRVIEAGDLALARTGGDVTVCYFDNELPVSPRSLDELPAAARRAGSEALGRLAEGYGALPASRLTDAAAVRDRHDRHQALRTELAELCRGDGTVAAALDQEIEAVNADPDRLDALLRRQNYRLARWRTAREELDYRRFFNIESLIGIRVEDPEVFARTHRLVVELVLDGTVDGLRVDHVDGLADPERYLADLAAATGGVYTVVEKILEGDEFLRRSWPAAGTSAYDFLIRVNDLFVDSGSEPTMTAAYQTVTRDRKLRGSGAGGQAAGDGQRAGRRGRTAGGDGGRHHRRVPPPPRPHPPGATRRAARAGGPLRGVPHLRTAGRSSDQRGPLSGRDSGERSADRPARRGQRAARVPRRAGAGRAPRRVRGVDAASISVLTASDGRMETSNATSAEMRAVDEGQYADGDGPCVEAIRTGQETIVSLPAERWPTFSDRAAQAGMARCGRFPSTSMTAPPGRSISTRTAGGQSPNLPWRLPGPWPARPRW